ncbi:MAG TPA: hypothetical protein VEB22_06575 [Phycisphaerales bacterium]|nr:hypothetical protein [Phycisphaerales bacterium]
MTDAEMVNDALWSKGRRGVVEINERLEPAGFVIGNGVVLLPAPGFMKDGRVEDATLSVPDEGEDALALQLEVRLLPEGDGPSEHARLLDRWEAYHGRRGAARFMVGVAQAARLGNAVVDGEELSVVNTLGNEPALLRRLNADRAALARGVKRLTGNEAFEPTAVGVDQRGVDVRTRTGVFRVPGPRGKQLDDDGAAAMVSELLMSGGAARD